MRLCLPFLCAAILFTPTALQTAPPYTAYAIDALHGVFGIWHPFGSLSTGGADEARWQQLFPALYLPPVPSRLLALDVSPHLEGTIRYKSLVITIGRTTTSSLSAFFAANLTSPVTVYSRQNMTLAWPSRKQWTRITFQTPYLYDGRSNLVIDVRKVIDRQANPNLGTVSHQNQIPRRNDLPWPIWASGRAGSGAANASRATTWYNGGPLLMRLVWSGAPTLTMNSTPQPGRQHYHLGATVHVTTQGTPGDVFFDALDVGLRAPLQVPGIQGSWWLQGLFNVLFIGVLDQQGRGTFNLLIPNARVLVGLHFYFQGATAGPGGVYFTNVVDGFVAP